MNILPKKRWHVRTKDNIARVRRDEAEAAKEEKERLRRTKLAEQEARTALLREKVKEKYDIGTVKKETKPEPGVDEKSGGHINFFKELEDGLVSFTGSNAEYEKEKKEEKEKYEKQIGYLTYLGQDTVESTGKVSWYNKIPDRLNQTSDSSEIAADKKLLIDPLNKIRPYISFIKSNNELIKSEGLSKDKRRKRKFDESSDDNGRPREKVKKKRRHKKHKTSKEKKKEIWKHKTKKCKAKKRKDSSRDCSSTDDDDESFNKSGSEDDCTDEKKSLDKLRELRLQREAEEKLRAQKHLAKLRGEPQEKEAVDLSVKQKYHSQFNPHLAKQNFLNDT